MESANKTAIDISATINAPIERVWDYFTMPAHITQWNQASDDWYTPNAASDLQEGGRFTYRMESKDGSMGFDFGGIYTVVISNEYIEYKLDDERKVEVKFALQDGDKTYLSQRFEPEATNPIEMQQKGWQSILDNFKKYVESNP